MEEATCAHCFEPDAKFRCPMCDDQVYCNEACCEADLQNHNPGPEGHCADMSIPCFQCFDGMRPFDLFFCQRCRFQCKVCNKTSTNNCAKCHSVQYCSKQCQLADWPNHKRLCRDIKSGRVPIHYRYPATTGDLSSEGNFKMN